MKWRLIAIIVLVFAVAAALAYYYYPMPVTNINQGPVVNINQSNSPTNQPSNTNVSAGPCVINVAQAATLYSRADAQSPVFGKADAGEMPQAGGKTADGWIGFDPGVAQAPNVGPFRLRWFAPDAPVSLSGDCSGLQVYPKLPPLACFTMAQTDTPIYKDADNKSDVVSMMHYGDYIEVVGQKGTDANMWIQVKSSAGSVAAGTTGWISGQDVDFNGQDCGHITQVK